ncbi:alpha/beta fold hydrolase [Shewanella sp. 202IG2-18]|uniref:alpha/beta fold hydrolase n=1 Tax=Parashewanella hymeniacidonis TaxID=2807618 RepID=UPI0019603F1E|nr:alpha/beta fold hydrolase [Parashewanella hymeniacidonis]MBM7074316.1 alpha/beta fold hydrolase [Parashewanella hymeniacidonis]
MKYSSETALSTPEQQKFWQQVEHRSLRVSHDVTLAYCQILNPNSNKAVVISNGRIECYEKYRELIFDIYRQGYSVYAVDHRGQGKSTRLTTKRHLGHVEKFNDYVLDFTLFVDQVVKPRKHQNLFLLCHSMGGTIGVLYMHQHPKVFKAAALSAPMLSIKLPAPRKVIDALAKALDFKTWPIYVLGGTDFKFKAFKDNDLTNSTNRYSEFHRIYRTYPDVQLGSPSSHWLREALTAADDAKLLLPELNTPTLTLQANQDSIIDNQAYDDIFGNLLPSSQCRRQIINPAKHEILVETDDVRTQALDAIFAFFSEHALK